MSANMTSTAGEYLMAIAKDIAPVPAELFAKIQINYYPDPADAAFIRLGQMTVAGRSTDTGA